MTKVCNKCKIEKPIASFWFNKTGKGSGKPRSRCKDCMRTAHKNWAEKNPDKVRAYGRVAYHKDIQRSREKSRAWRETNPDKVRTIINRWANSDAPKAVLNRLKSNLRKRMLDALSGRVKSARTTELLGCSIEHLRVWLTFWFQPGMSWANYGTAWVIDHDRPCASFDLTDPAQQRECFHFTNLRPLHPKKNLEKGDSWEAAPAPDPDFDLISICKDSSGILLKKRTLIV